MLVTSTPTKIMLLGAVFQVLQNPYAEIRKFVTGVCSGTPIHACWSKSVQDKCLKGRVVLMTQKNKMCFGAVWRNPWGNFPGQFLCECALCYHNYTPGFIQTRSDLRELYPENLSLTPKVNTI